MVLPTPHDIAPLPSPPESDDDLEAGRGHDADLSLTREDATENIGLVSSTRRKGKSKSPIRREGTDAAADLVLPLHTPPSFNDVVTRKSASSKLQTQTSLSAVVPTVPMQVASTSNPLDLLMDTAPSGMYSAPPLQPSSKETEDMKFEMLRTSNLEPDTEPDATTIRLVGGGGETGMSQNPVETNAEEVEETQSDSSHTVHHGKTLGHETSTPVATPNKENKKSKSSLASLKRFSVAALGRKRDSVSSVKDALSR